jgi:hypothetical protein
MQFGRSFSLLRHEAPHHENVNHAFRQARDDPKTVTRNSAGHSRNNIDRNRPTPKRPEGVACVIPKLGIAPFSPP